MCKKSKRISTIVSYLIGVPDKFLAQDYEGYEELISELRSNESATIVRCLCKLRTTLLKNFKKTDQKMRYFLKNLTSMSEYDQQDIEYLQSHGLQIIQANYSSEKYIKDFYELIDTKIDDCKSIFLNYDWLKWSYIRELFVRPGFRKANELKDEFTRFMSNIKLYPYGCYINWNAEDVGNLMSNDVKLLTNIYKQHKDKLDIDEYKINSSSTSTKQTIYDFIGQSDNTIMVVDCENTNIFKFYGMMCLLNNEEISKISKIVFYHDKRDEAQWSCLRRMIKGPEIVFQETQRVNAYKSSLDIYLTGGIYKLHYEENVTAFVLVSSDCDYWGVISQLPNVDFFVLYECESVGSRLVDLMDEHKILHAALDDFGSDGTEQLKKEMLSSGLDSVMTEMTGALALNINDLTDKIFEAAHINASEEEKKAYRDKYVRNIKIKISDDGNMYFVI